MYVQRLNLLTMLLRAHTIQILLYIINDLVFISVGQRSHLKNVLSVDFLSTVKYLALTGMHIIYMYNKSIVILNKV